MKSKISFWAAVGFVIAAASIIASNNILASLFVGAGSSTLLMIVTNLEVDKKVRN